MKTWQQATWWCFWKKFIICIKILASFPEYFIVIILINKWKKKNLHLIPGWLPTIDWFKSAYALTFTSTKPVNYTRLSLSNAVQNAFIYTTRFSIYLPMTIFINEFFEQSMSTCYKWKSAFKLFALMSIQIFVNMWSKIIFLHTTLKILLGFIFEIWIIFWSN